MNIIVIILVLCIVAFGALHLFRWPLFNAAVRAQRRKGGLRENTLRVDDHDITYLEGGSGDPLLLLHGFGANKDNWIQIAPLLTPHYRLIIPDVPGFGDSTRNPSSRYGAKDQLERLVAFVERLGLGPVHIAGNSMGGFLAGYFAAEYPDKTASVWLLAPAGVAGADPSEYFQCLERGDNPLLVNNADDFKRLVDFCFTKAPYMPGAFRRCLAERNIEERDFNEKVFTDLFENPVELEETMRGCTVPTFLVWGDEDRILHPSGAKLLASVLPSVEMKIMTNMGHCPMLERPAESAADFLRFQSVAR